MGLIHPVDDNELDVLLAIQPKQRQPSYQAPIEEPPVFEKAPFQLEDLDKLEERDWSANWSEMGCYKTTTVEWLIQEKLGHYKNPRVLVITTRTGKGTYFKTARSVLPDFQVLNCDTKGVKLVWGGVIEVPVEGIPNNPIRPTLVVTHYNTFSRRKPRKVKDEAVESIISQLIKQADDKEKKQMVDLLQEVEWDMVILDEAHRIKGQKTGWTKEIKKLKARYRHVMTGTGFINNPAEIWSLLNFLNKYMFSSYWKFRRRYCLEEVDFNTGYTTIVGIKPETKEEFQKLVMSIGPRRTKREVFKNLPDPIDVAIDVELNPTQQRMYDAILDNLMALDQDGVSMYSPHVLAQLTRLRQITVATPHVIDEYFDEEKQKRVQKIELREPSSKLDSLMEIIEGLEWDDERRDQIVVFSNFKDPIKLAKARFEKAGISYLEMSEKDSDQVRYHKWGVEFPKKNHQVFICTLQLGSESISLTSATTCVFLDRSWSPKDNEQGRSRVWRPGQEEAATIININALQTTDQRVESVVNTKMGWFREIFGDERRRAE